VRKKIAFLAAVLLVISPVQAHDVWLQVNSNVIRIGDNVHIDLMLGNHGNNHRDFKLAGKIDPAADKLEIVDPDGKRYDLKEQLVDLGYTPKEGFWTTTFAGAKPGMYVVAYSSDHVVSYAPKRALMSAKSYFVVSKSLDRVSMKNPGFDRVLGHAFELVPIGNPVTPMGPGTPIKVQLLFKGKPAANTRVSFIPRGEVLSESFDKRYERMTDAAGYASFTPTLANYYLVAAHREEPDEKGQGYESTKYSATLSILVPKICPCCGE
jgi:uncharacterized GH25 family protein